jgi:hypothetical protein
MGDQQIDNPAGAFQPLDPDTSIPTTGVQPGQAPSYRYVNVVNSGAVAIKVGDWVQLDVSGTASVNVFGVKRGVHGGVLANGIGFAMDPIAVNGYGRVITEGPALARAGAAGVASGVQVVGSTVSTDDGEVVAASSPSVGQVLGTNVGGTIAAGALFAVWVAKC